MLHLKKNKQTDSSQKNAAFRNTVAEKIAGILLNGQVKFCNVVNTYLSKMSIQKLKIMLITFCVGAGGYSIYLIGNSIAGGGKKEEVNKVGRLSLPKHFRRTGDELSVKGNYIDDKSFNKIEQVKNYLDSLKLSNKKIYDSILRARPLLLDSISILEAIYYSQKQK